MVTLAHGSTQNTLQIEQLRLVESRIRNGSWSITCILTTRFPLADRPELFRPFDTLRTGEISLDAAWDEYLTHLRLVLYEVGRLLENLDAKEVVITADHGEAFGEFGFYRHVIGCPLPSMRKVPWVKTCGTDREKYEPHAPAPKSTNETTSAEERLEDLGYL